MNQLILYLSLITNICFVLSSQQYDFDSVVIECPEDKILKNVEIVDIDNNGFNDYIYTLGGVSNIMWYKNFGSDSLVGPLTLVALPNTIKTLHVGDINNDEILDFVCVFPYDQHDIVVINNDNGQFSTSSIDESNFNYVATSLTDIDNDGCLDIITFSNEDSTIGWFRNDCNGIFSQWDVLKSNIPLASSFKTCDFDGDGDQDIIFTRYVFQSESGSKTLFWYRNDGNTMFSDDLIIKENITAIRDLKFADVDNDGDNDILIVHSKIYDDEYSTINNQFIIEGIFWVFNDNQESYPVNHIFDNSSAINNNEATHYSQLSAPNDVALIDINNDGLIDVLRKRNYDSFDNPVVYYLNLDSGEFDYGVIPYEHEYPLGPIVSSDINNDQASDLVISASYGTEFFWLESLAGSVVKKNFTLISPYNFEIVKCLDIDGNGYSDILVNSCSDSYLGRCLNNSSDFENIEQIPVDTECMSSFLLADINNDSSIDLIYADDNTHQIILSEHFESNATNNVIANNFEDVSQIQLGDIDQNGNPNIIVSSTYNYYASTFKYDSDSNAYSAEGTITFNNISIGTIVADIDGDGNQDIITGYRNSDEIVWFRNVDGGNYSEEIQLSNTAQGISSLVAIDLDNDNDNDVLAVFSDYDKIVWFKNDGIGNFGTQNTLISNFTSVKKIVVEDINGDGFKDIIGSTYPSFENTLFLNAGNNINPIFLEGQNLGSQTETGQLLNLIDFDNDNDPDLLISNTTDDIIKLYSNWSKKPTCHFQIAQNCYQINEEIEIENKTQTTYQNSTLEWSFGDGQTSNEIQTNHQFNNTGEFEIKLVVCNNFGCDSMSQYINVSSFEFDIQEQVQLHEEILFSNISSGITNFTWFFGDGNQSLEQQPIHTYSEPGTYEITVILTNNEIQDCTFTENYTVTVVDDAVGIESTTLPNELISINNSPTGTKIHWNNDDGNSSKLQILDLNGKVLLQEEFENASYYFLPANSLLQGLYLVRVLQDGNAFSEKLVVR